MTSPFDKSDPSVQGAAVDVPRGSEVRGRHFGPRVLLIDDDVDARHLLTQMLVKRGAEVIGASGPAQALEVIATFEENDRPWSLVIMDVMMPGLDGSAFIRDLHSIPSVAGAPVLLHSALSSLALEQTMRDWRAQGFIMKSRGRLHIDTEIQTWLTRIKP